MAENGFASPSIDPASRGDLSGVMRFVLTKFLQGVDDMLPARVVSYDRSTNRATVQPLIMIVTTDQKHVERGQSHSIPVLQMGGGGFVMSWPIKTGDLGWIKANDRDISLFMQSMKSEIPNTQRKHSFEDALFIPDSFMRQVSISPEDQDAVTIQNAAGTIKIALRNDSIELVAPSVNVSGNIVATGDIVAGGISLLTHVHGGVQTGGGNTGGPL